MGMFDGFGDNLDDPKKQALLAMAMGLLSHSQGPGNKGVGGALQGFGQAGLLGLNQYHEATRQKLASEQQKRMAEMQGLDIEAKRRTNSFNTLADAGARNFTTPGQPQMQPNDYETPSGPAVGGKSDPEAYIAWLHTQGPQGIALGSQLKAGMAKEDPNIIVPADATVLRKGLGGSVTPVYTGPGKETDAMRNLKFSMDRLGIAPGSQRYADTMTYFLNHTSGKNEDVRLAIDNAKLGISQGEFGMSQAKFSDETGQKPSGVGPGVGSLTGNVPSWAQPTQPGRGAGPAVMPSRPLVDRPAPSADTPMSPRDTRNLALDQAKKTAGSEDARSRVTGYLGQLKDYYLNLDKQGSTVDAERGVGSNVLNRIASSKVGQVAGEAWGSPQQAIRGNINAMRPLLLNEIRQASQMGARGLDSNKELEFYLQAATDPTKDIATNLRALEALEKAYGLSAQMTRGKVKMKTPTSGWKYLGAEG